MGISNSFDDSEISLGEYVCCPVASSSEPYNLERIQLVTEVSRDLALISLTVRAWVKRAEPVPEEDPISDNDKAELSRLRAENKRLRQERNILVKPISLDAHDNGLQPTPLGAD